ncbi:hypothetical protein BDV59DRAFT_201490 [Aspergillus ambiguus]|uniref:oxidase ustYa family protein n=1 Tax=Aspergillus ambiguus TaxID=176160 RepID=UPI003CCCFB8A
MPSPMYNPLKHVTGNAEDDYKLEEASDPFLPTLHSSTRGKRLYMPQHWPWILSTVVLAITCIVSLTRSFYRPSSKNGSYETGFITDLHPAVAALEIEQRKFTGGLHWDEDGKLVRNQLPEGQEWVGTPTPEMDALWQRVVDAGGIDLSGKDADMVRGTTRQRPTGEWIAGLDEWKLIAYQNKLRQSLYPDYYHDPDGKAIETLHIEHCIDYLRQSIMCNSDMTVLRLVYSPSADRWNPDFEGTHTCRNFDKLLSWSLGRLNPTTEEYWRSGKGSSS